MVIKRITGPVLGESIPARLLRCARSRRGSRAIALSLISIGALTLSSLSPTLVGTAYAQADYSDEDITNYARAVFDIEAKRSVAFDEASNILLAADSEIDILETPLSCTRNRMADMPDISRAGKVALRTVLITFCNEASELAEANDLSPTQFNEMTQAHREDAELAERIQDAISEL